MDIYCPKCAEPWEVDTLHEVAEEEGRTFTNVRLAFRSKGCVALGGRCNPDTVANPILGELMDLAGDDVDGLGVDLEDFQLFGLELEDRR